MDELKQKILDYYSGDYAELSIELLNILTKEQILDFIKQNIEMC